MSEESKDSINSIQEFIDKGWKGFEAIEFESRLLFPAVISKRTKSGKFEHQEVAIQVPRAHELRKARTKAREIAQKEGLDLKLDKDLVEDLENVCILTKAIRNIKPPHEQWAMNHKDLEENWDRQSIFQIWRQLEELFFALDPSRHETIPEDQFILMLSAMVKERSIHPLAVYGQDALSSFILTMADRLVSYMGSK